HLFYFREMVRITTLRIELAEKLMLYKEQIQPGNIDEITNSTVTKVIDTFSKWIKRSYELEALLHEDGLLARDTVRGILKNTEKHKYIGSMAIARESISDVDAGEARAKRFIQLENEERKELRDWIDLDEIGKDASSIEIYTKDLRYTKTAEILAKAALEELMSTLWVFS